MPQKYTDDEWLELMAGRKLADHEDTDTEEVQLLRKRLQLRHSIIHESVQNNSEAEIQRITARLKKEGVFNPPIKESLWQQIVHFIPSFNPIWATAFASILLVVGLLARNPSFMTDVHERIDQYRGITQNNFKPLFPNEVVVGNDVQVVEDPALALADWEADLIGADIKYQSSITNADKQIIELHILLSKNKQNLSEAHHRSLFNSPDQGEWVIVFKKHQ